MLKHIDSKKMGRSQHGWLDSHFHFSFAEYYNPQNIQFGVLRVVNDDIIQPGAGFDTHPHSNMEIISYIVDGSLTHADSIGNQHTLTRGQVQYMSAGTGISHSEYNLGKEWARFLQIWILPDQGGYPPAYGNFPFKFDDRKNKWMPIASGVNNSTSSAPVRLHQDINMAATLLEKGSLLDFSVEKGRQAYLVLIEGEANINGIELKMRDALEIVEEDITIHAMENAHILVIEMAKPTKS